MEHLGPGLGQGELLLENLCLQRQVISGISERVRFYPGCSLLTESGNHQVLIEGRYGLVLTLGKDTEVVVAQCGFDLREKELVVTNTPQGLTRDKLSAYTEATVKAVMRELKKGSFRDELLSAVIKIGEVFRTCGIERIRGIAAEHHDKVDINGGPLSLDVALKSMNQLYEKHGFARDEWGDYYLPL